MEGVAGRERVWSKLGRPWDILIVGGGITGAGLFREAVRLGLQALLVEQRDFAWGTSSRSSKLVHGGLRYLKEGDLMLTRAAVQERQELMAEGPGLVDPLGFLLSVYKGNSPGRFLYGIGLSIYDLLALRWDHTYHPPEEFQMLAPHISREGLQGGFYYGDAQTDDARLVLRVLLEAVEAGGKALNYVAAEELLFREDPSSGRRTVVGAVIRDLAGNRRAEVQARVVVNATGAWADVLRSRVGAPPRMRPLRGSHLIFPAWRIPVAQALCFIHPADGRPVFIFPWEGITLVGTTDVDHLENLQEEPAISPDETAYLMSAVEAQFPGLNLKPEDVISSFAGVRPVIGTGKADPSQESRDHVVWEEEGLVTVTGGKLTTFRLIAHDVLQAIRSRLPGDAARRLDAIEDSPILNPVAMNMLEETGLDGEVQRRLIGRYGAAAPLLISGAAEEERAIIPGTNTVWAELRWACRTEGVVHLDDLLLRRVRIGLLLPYGGAEILERVGSICREELGWDDARWNEEKKDYLELWKRCYSLPPREEIPDWKQFLEKSVRERNERKRIERRRQIRGTVLAGIVIGTAAGLLVSRHLRKKGRAEETD
ncbi:MAG: glycerol-3-phosphate dehydrogenase/oxidase [Syntrophaceae bacterium]|nr:glycerol-3-phosphate dehydrogenase/oxidase [Syntrophaceae bacterium]